MAILRQLTKLTYGPSRGWTETNTFNALGQLTERAIPSLVDWTYTFSTAANNLQIEKQRHRAEHVDYGEFAQPGDGAELRFEREHDVWCEQYSELRHRQPRRVGEWYGPDNKRVYKKRQTGPSTYVEDVYFYGIGTGLLATFQITSGYLSVKEYNVRFMGKLIKQGPDDVVTDRLGSVKYRKPSGTAVRHDFRSYGEEKPSATAQDRISLPRIIGMIQGLIMRISGILRMAKLGRCVRM